MFQFIFIVGIFLPITIQSKGHWSYENMRAWANDYHYCGGHLQSPIDIRFNNSQYVRRLKQIHFNQEYSNNESLIVNNGHTAQLQLRNYLLKNIFPYGEAYRTEQIHFHWGDNNNFHHGSEHSFEGRLFPLEMHIVSYSRYFQSIYDAMLNARSLAVIGVFFQLSNESNPNLQPLVDALQFIVEEGSRTNVSKDFDIKKLIGEKNLRRYYRYDGSLTTPPCYESVIWTVLEKPLEISLEQLRQFQSLRYKNSSLMKNTYRIIQPIQKRKLYRSFRSQNSDDQDLNDQKATADRNLSQNLSFNLKILFFFIIFLRIL